MNGNELLENMELMDFAYVEAAEKMPGKQTKRWPIRLAAAVGAAAVIFAGIRLIPRETPAQPLPGLPMLTLPETWGGGYGFEGYMAYDVSELVNANPWAQSDSPSALPVYQDSLPKGEDPVFSAEGWAKMREFLVDVAGRLGLAEEALTITDNSPDEEAQRKLAEKYQSVGEEVPAYSFAPTALVARAEGIKIEVDQFLTAKITFEPAVSLPEEYNFTHFATYAEKAAAAEYLLQEYRELVGFAQPQVNIHGGDYNIDHQQGYQIEFFDRSGDQTEQIVNYHFNRVAFYCNDEGKLFLARVFSSALYSKVGDYPIISAEQAGEQLLNGGYITSVPYDFPGKKYVGKVELIYRTGKHEDYYLPYYRFYVEIPEAEREEGMKTYGAYYVPAVESIYLAGMTVWDGSFN